MTDKTYNGWTNYATWRINLEIFDGFDPIEDWGLEYETLTESELAELLQEHAEELLFPDGLGNATLAETYAQAFLSDVNWYEIASHKIEEV